MEWVEVTAKTVDEAKDTALDQLGVDEADAEFEVLEEPKGGLFGRLRSEARVRARVLPTAPRAKVDRRDRRRSGGGRERTERTPRTGRSDGGTVSAEPSPRQASASATPPEPAPRSPRRSRSATTAPRQGAPMTSDAPTADGGEVAETFVRGLLDAFDSPHTIVRNDLGEDTQEIAVTGDELGLLIGPGGQTLAAVQELTRTVVQRHAAGHHGWIVVDVGGYRKLRRESLERFTRDVAAQVLETGVPRVLEAMPPADRKVIHDTANALEGISTSSEGEEPRRRVVITPASDAD
ncbi:MAG: Jag N-terminal domain-containing protein [Acidimicrobiia bacterium]|nr:Jag N-terminal domain-containing protein [Acidimicrobiia bacterium]